MAIRERLEGMPVVGTAMAVQARYKADAADPLAAAIGFFGFLSLFPLLLLAVSVAGFVLEDPDDQLAVASAITEAIPGFQETLADDEASTEVADLVSGVVDQRGTIGVVGLLLLLFSGLRVVNAAMVATRVVFRGHVLKGVGVKVRQVVALVGLGALALLGVAGSSLAGIGLGQLPGVVAVLLSLVVSFAFDLLLFLGAYRLLSPTSRMSGRRLLPGALLGAAGWTALKVAGSSYVGNQIDDANALYGALGGVIALLLLLYLAGRLYLYGAELSAVLAERRDGPLTPPEEDDVDEVRGEDVEVGAEGAAPQATDRAGVRPVPVGAAARPVDPGPHGVAPTVMEPTRARLAAVERRREIEATTAEPGGAARHAIGFGIGIAALAAAWRFLGPGRE